MDELLTTRQVQERLKVDRITIYRMLGDGRLKGVKIGQQWRFPASEVERLLSGAAEIQSATVPSRSFPTHCVQTIQNLFAEISELGALVVDTEGNPLTDLSSNCRYCHMLLSTPGGEAACRQSWRSFAAGSGEELTCHAGLRYLRSPIREGNEVIGWFLAGHLKPQRDVVAQAEMNHLAELYGLSAGDLRAAYAEIPALDAPDYHHVEGFPARASAAIQAILQERSGFMQRLQSIAEMTKL
jgi:excisionase family DNA binding protein